ncbi:MAG: efflux RND transporter permease subunit [Candidatus Omnitrophica bacterium]|nr:efflux RND transporter permease subunit [Candidatus Omnitrophota bacterium]
MTITEFTLSRKVTVIMIVLGIVLLGLISVTRTKQQLFPTITFPQLTVVTEYANSAPEEIETLLTKPIEEALGSVSGLRKMISISREGKSIITVSFSWGADIDFAALAVREKLDLVKEKLPKEAADPQVIKFDPLARPIMILSVTGSQPLMELKVIAEKTLKENLEKVEGVASAGLSGGLDREILVEVDQGRLLAARLSLLGISDQLERANLSYPAGSIKKGLHEYLIRTVGEFKTVDEVPFAVAGLEQKEPLKRKESSFLERSSAFYPRQTIEMQREKTRREDLTKRLIYFRDIASVQDTFKDITSISRYNGLANISISIQKQADANTIQVCDRVRESLALLGEELENRKASAQIIYDGSVFIKAAIRDVADNAWQGGLLAFLCLILVLRNFLSAFVVILVIPVTIMGVFFLMFIKGITFNMMSLAGVTLGVGMVIDNGIVIIENIFRLRQQGMNAREATIEGTEEVFWPIISSSLTNIAVFFPLIIFVPGVAGQIFKDLSWTVIFSLIIAIFAALFIVPLFAIKMKLKEEHPKPGEGTPLRKPNLFEKLSASMNHKMEKLAQKSEKAQNRTLYEFLGLALGLFLIGIFLLARLDQEVIPRVDQGQFLIKVNMPVGTNIQGTDNFATPVEKIIRENRWVESVALSIGSTEGSEGQSGVETLRASQAQILVTLKKKRKAKTHQVVQAVKSKIDLLDARGAEVEYIEGESEFAFAAGGAKPVVIEIKGFDLNILAGLTAKVEKMLAGMDGVFGITDDLAKKSPETKIVIDKKKAALYGISARDISLTAKAAIEGLTPTKFKEEGREYDMRVRLRETDRSDAETLGDLLIKSTVIDAMVPLKELAQLEVGEGPSEIRHKDQQRTITITADILKGVNKSGILRTIDFRLSELEVPENYSISPAGEAQEARESFNKILFALFLAITLVYMIMAAQFESFVQPFIIMFTVPLSIFGVALALFLTGKSMSVIVLLGIVMLGGVVVNNGIVLMEFINGLRAKGMSALEAAFNASKIRMRPILMSAITSIIGLLPMAMGFGEGGELRAPLAITVMGGQASSTLFSLIVIPALYVLMDRAMEWIFGRPYEEGDEDLLLSEEQEENPENEEE